ncbi:hypothetical protein EFR91_02960 [Lactobacillus amylovorus]|uniref:hypothetical protein n=1 Tax=Lactobacillus amylovorus TaxID=1604 RepID=UPI0021A639E7|nr:hypothetical protein [Lactobacillus amylovorus]MCT3595609.1 hypothetical protein [Lactobacillus amylovorus]
MIKDKETLLKEYFKEVKRDFEPSIRYGLPYFDVDEKIIVDVDFKGNQGSILEFCFDDLEIISITIDNDFSHTKCLKKLSWLFERTAKLIEDLRKVDEGWLGKPEGNYDGED